MINILSLDVASQTGWCTKTAHGLWDLRPKRDESSGMRLIRFKHKLLEILKLEEINLVTYERTSGRHKASIIVQSELHGIVKSVCEEQGIDYRAFSAGEIKKYATGKGNANKEAMIQAAKDKLGYQGNDDNVADAMWIYEVTKSSLSI